MAVWLLCVTEQQRFDPKEFTGNVHDPAGGKPHDRFKGFPAKVSDAGVTIEDAVVAVPEMIKAEQSSRPTHE